MTKKHFEAIASILSEYRPEAFDRPEVVYSDMVSALADYFESENPNFDRDRFVAAAS